MVRRSVPGTDVDYELVLFDKYGDERADPDGTLFTSRLDLLPPGLTDIYVLSHGWKGDIPAALAQYDRWLGAMAEQVADRTKVRQLEPAYKPLVVAVHWPSLPWGAEDVEQTLLGLDDNDELQAELELNNDELVELYADRIADTPEVRAALVTIVDAAEDPEINELVQGDELPTWLDQAYQKLYDESHVGSGGALAAPGEDQDLFEPAVLLKEWDSVGIPTDQLLGAEDVFNRAKKKLLGPVRQVSFWTMKRRARLVGETGVHRLLAALQQAAPSARLHLMGHSFGSIVVSAAIAGPFSDGLFPSRLPRPVHAVFLMQGAMSLWSFAHQVPFEDGLTGYFQPLLVEEDRIRGPLVATLSSYDKAVGTFYPLGVRASDEFLLDQQQFPKFGGIGAFGIQGVEVEAIEIMSATSDYQLTTGQVLNVDAGSVINSGNGLSGAHSDLAHPETAHLMWEAVHSSIAQAPLAWRPIGLT